MLLCVNVSNSNITFGVFCENNLLFKSTIATKLNCSVDEYAVTFYSILTLHGCKSGDITGVILSCVVPSVSTTIKSALKHIYKEKIFVVGPGLKTGIKIKGENPSQVGASLISQSAALIDKYPLPCLLISMGTALSIFAIDKDGTFIGGSILPSIKMSATALSEYTAQLPQINLSAPVKNVIGTNTAQNIQSGLIFGTACSINGMITHFKDVLGENLTCVATGEISKNILTLCNKDIIYHENLVLDGLKILYDKNTK